MRLGFPLPSAAYTSSDCACSGLESNEHWIIDIFYFSTKFFWKEPKVRGPTVFGSIQCCPPLIFHFCCVQVVLLVVFKSILIHASFTVKIFLFCLYKNFYKIYLLNFKFFTFTHKWNFIWCFAWILLTLLCHLK